jgi:hypothetical protein
MYLNKLGLEWLDFSQKVRKLRREVGSNEHSNESSGAIQGWKFLGYSSYGLFRRKNLTPGSCLFCELV